MFKTFQTEPRPEDFADAEGYVDWDEYEMARSQWEQDQESDVRFASEQAEVLDYNDPAVLLDLLTE